MMTAAGVVEMTAVFCASWECIPWTKINILPLTPTVPPLSTRVHSILYDIYCFTLLLLLSDFCENVTPM